jgi:hypothetical protein
MRPPSPPLAATATVVAVGVVASLAFGVPALLRRQHETEALRELGRIVRAASVYYVKPRPQADGSRMPCQFPQGQIRTTLAFSCCDRQVGDGSGLCDPGKIEWNRTLWHALRFQLKEPHAFVYAYEGQGTMADARMTASAYADLDCDGVYSTFRFTMHGDRDARTDDCVLTGEPVFAAVQPDE